MNKAILMICPALLINQVDEVPDSVIISPIAYMCEE
jgi:hypothetical protein